MTQPHVDARADMTRVHDSLRDNGGETLAKAELRTRWLDENPKATLKDYYRIAGADPEGHLSAIESLKGRFDVSLRGVSVDESLIKKAVEVDRAKFKLDGDAALFADNPNLRGTYDNLRDRFKDEVLYGFDGNDFYKLDTKEVYEFRTLVDFAKAGAQRNATELATELGTAMASIDEREPRTNTDLFKRLEDLKTALKEWNKLLASEALPSADALEKQGDKVVTQLGRCRQEHADRFSTEQNPFVKFQLLATMRAIGEKVAAQFAARAGAPTFAAMCALIVDVPRSSSGIQPDKKLSKDLGKAFSEGLLKLEKDLRKVDPQLADGIRAALLQQDSAHGVKKALDTWSANYTDPNKLTTNIGASRDAIATIALGLGTYRTVADNFLAKSKNADVKTIKERYQQTFDGLTSKLQSDIDLCVYTLGR